MANELHLHPVMICGTTEDVYVSTIPGGAMLFSKALEPLVVLGYCASKWLLVANSAGLLAWFYLFPDESISTATENSLPIRQQSFSVSDISSDKLRRFSLQYLHNMYSSDQIRRILSSVSDSLRSLNADCYFPESDCSTFLPQCSSLPKDECEFYANIARKWVNENLSKSFVAGQHEIHCLPTMCSSNDQKNVNSDSINFLCKWLADSVRNNTGLRYCDAMKSVKATLLALKRPAPNGGVVIEENVEALNTILFDAEIEARKITQSAVTTSPDKETLESLLLHLMEWIEDAQRSATWRSSADDSELLRSLQQMKQLLEDADPELCVSILQKASPQALESITALYQLENAQDIRCAIRDFVLNWMQLLFTVRAQDPTNTLMLRMFASESGGGVLLGELLREFTSNDSLSENASKSIMSLIGILVENRSEFLGNTELPNIAALFDAALRVAMTHNGLLPLCLEFVEKIVSCSISGDSVDGGKKYGALLSSSLVTAQSAEAVELAIDGIIQRYLSLTVDKFLSSKDSKRVFSELIAVLIFWSHAVADPELLEHGLVHTSDLHVLIDFCVRQLEMFEIDSSCPKSLQDAYSTVHKLFVNATNMEFF